MILLVEHNPITRKMLRFALEAEGYDVVDAADGRAALEISATRRPDLLVLDYALPDMDGLQLLAEVRRQRTLPELPAIIVTGLVSRLEELRAQGGAAIQFLAKPVAPSRLLEIVGAQLSAPVRAAPRGPALAASSGRRVLVLDDEERLQVQLERQTARNEALLRQAAVQATALSICRGLSEVLAEPKGVTQILGDVLVRCLDAAGLSTGLLYVADPGGGHRLKAQFGITADQEADAKACFGHPELIRRIVEALQPVAFSSGAEATDAESHDFLARLGQSSALIVPFVVLGETYGELVLASDSYDLSESAWIAFARSLALQFGQTVALGQSLKRLAESEGRYRVLMEQANDAIFILDTAGTILEANHRSETLLGLPRDRVIGRQISDFAPVVERAENLRKFQEAVDARGGLADNVVLRRGDGVLVQADFSLSLNDIEGKAYVLSIGRDVTGRNRAEAALREAQQRLHHVVSSSPAVLYSLRVAGQTLVPGWVSDNIERLSGYTPADVTGPAWWSEHVHPDDREDVLAQVPILLSKGYVVREYRFRHQDGSYRWVRDEQVLIQDATGSPEVVGSWWDVSARKEAELRLRESEERYRRLFESNPFPMWVYDQESFAFLAVNDAALRHYGYTREEFLAMTALDIRPPEEVAAFTKEYEEYLAKQGPTSYYSRHTFKHRKKDGAIIEVDIAANPILFEGRRAWLLLATDVTERRTLEAQLLQSQKMESMGRLAGGIAHDFNNLLGIITGYGDLLRRRVAADPRLTKYVDDIVKAAERAGGLTRQLLAFSRKQVLQPRILDLNALVDETQKMLRRLIGEDVQLVTVLDETLGPVRADPGQIDQILVNLAVNARDAMPRGGRLTIETRNVALDESYARQHAGVEPGRYVMLAVSDTGHGMTPEVRGRIFEPFFTTKGPGKGTGLGLATVHGIVTQSGGHVFVYSEAGHGTSFKVYLPRTDVEVTAPPPESTAGPLPRGSETILLVEDEASLRALIRECLEDTGYTVLDARHGGEALEVCERHEGPIHLLVTDVVMPEMGGRELGEWVRASRPDIHVLYMSGYTDDAIVLHGVLSEGMAFLQKPFTAEALARKVRELLDQPAGESS